MMVPFAFMYLIFLGIVGMGQHMVSSIIEEKNSRIIEVLLSAISPFELMAGKIAGLAAVGLAVTALWGAAAYGAARWQGIQIDIGAGLLVSALVYYILGFVLFSAILAGVGSVCNTIKETQSLMMPIMLVFVIPMIAWPRLAQEPNGELARVLSYVPPTTPMVMVLRLSSGTGHLAGRGGPLDPGPDGGRLGGDVGGRQGLSHRHPPVRQAPRHPRNHPLAAGEIERSVGQAPPYNSGSHERSDRRVGLAPPLCPGYAVTR